jgi:hypothetical protein
MANHCYDDGLRATSVSHDRASSPAWVKWSGPYQKGLGGVGSVAQVPLGASNEPVPHAVGVDDPAFASGGELAA